MSSANSLVRSNDAQGRSLIYNKNRRGPSTDPWGTPISIGSSLDFEPFTNVYCLRLLK